MATIIVKVRPGGESQVKVEGVSGGSCKDLSKGIEAALGAVASDRATEEMYAPEFEGVKTKTLGG